MSNVSKQKQTQVEQNANVLKTEAKASVSFSPLPSSEELERLEALYPGTIDRILRMAEKEQQERINANMKILEIESKDSDASNRFSLRAQWFAISSVFAVIGLCAYFAYLGNVSVAGTTAQVIIAALAAVFLGEKLIRARK